MTAQKIWRFVIAILLLAALLEGCDLYRIANAAPADEAPTAEIQLVSQDLNHVEIEVAWQNASAETPHVLDWGDDTQTMIEGFMGIQPLTHDFAYNVNEMTLYTIQFTVSGPGGETTDTLEITIDDRPETPTSSIEIVGQNFNSVVFRVTWTSGKADATHRVVFGDGSETGVTGSEGEQNIVHDFAYVPGDLTSYWVAFTVIGGAEEVTVAVEVVLDDRHETYSVFMPAVIAPAAEPASCSISTTTGDIVNRINFSVVWSNGNGGPYKFVFGDGAETTVGDNANGTGSTSHDYSYVPGGIKEYEVAMWMSDSGATCSQTVVIDDQH